MQMYLLSIHRVWYEAAFSEAVQLACIDVHAASVPAFTAGASGVAGSVAYVIVNELADVPQVLTALTL